MQEMSILQYSQIYRYMGIDWIPENNNPVITCPLRPDYCDKRFSDDILGDAHGGGLTKIFQCDLRLTDKPYDYEKSIEKLKKDIEHELLLKREAYYKQKHNHVCTWHLNYNDWDRQYHQRYDPLVCARYCQNKGKTCDLTGREVSKKRGNVFYDMKVTQVKHSGDLFDGQEIVTIRRNIRFLEHPTSITICNEIAKRCRRDIEDHVRMKQNGEAFEIMNIRAEQRESRTMISRAENAVINHMGLSRAPKEMFETKVLIADLQLAQRKKRCKKRGEP